MGKHDRHRAANQEKDWNLRSEKDPASDPDGSPSKDDLESEGGLEGDDESAGVPPSFAREIKIGLAALGALLVVLGVVVWSRLRQRDETPPPHEKVAGAQQGDTQSPIAKTATPPAKVPRELTATEPKEPFLPPRQAAVSAAQARVLSSESPGPGPANPFGAHGGPSFMPKVTKPASEVPLKPIVARSARAASPFAAADSLPPEPPGDEVTVGEGPADPFHNRIPVRGTPAQASQAMATSAPADGTRQPASAPASPVGAGLSTSSPNPLRGASGSGGLAAGDSRPWGSAASASASPSPLSSGAAGGLPRPASSVESAGPVAVAPAVTPMAASGAAPAAAQPAGSAGRVYIVREGDTLYDIARNQLGKASRWGEIYDLNWDQLGNRVDGLVPGMKLVLPDDAGQPAGMLSRNPLPSGTTSTLKR